MSETPLAARLKALIAGHGPMSVADYMAHCLGDPEHGYYVTRDPLGAAGDFTTAPEISQMFGEMIGAWLVHVWEMAGRSEPVRIAELGPGRGTLMRDMLRVIRRAPNLLPNATIHLIETSPVLRARQQALLSHPELRIAWHADPAAIPPGFLLLAANEFLDALPVRQFVRTGDAWRERVIGLDAEGALGFGIGAGLLPDGPAAPEGAVLEISAAREGVVQALAERIATTGGAALLIDYGHAETATGDTLQAVRGHAYADVLAAPGEADLTSHVDFAALTGAARTAGAHVHGPLEQGKFLLALGIAERAEQLSRGKDESTRAAIFAAVHRLTAPEEMGRLFKVLAITQPGLHPPPFGPAV